jgi:hypothetical protein
MNTIKTYSLLLAGCITLLAVLACTHQPATPHPATFEALLNGTVSNILQQTPSARPQTAIPTAQVAILPSATQLPTATFTPIPSVTPIGFCAIPPDDYTRVEYRGVTLNARTVAMLENAHRLYQGNGDLLYLTQGSYNDSISASFGTHSGGGALDISVRNPQNRAEFLPENEITQMVLALRQAGFAAWFRAADSLGVGSAPHIHAIAVGDQELSASAELQVSGAGGYLNGYDGLPEPLGPNVDPLGGAVVCDWMTLP